MAALPPAAERVALQSAQVGQLSVGRHTPRRWAHETPRFTPTEGSQPHNVEMRVEEISLSVVNLQEAYAEALLVDRSLCPKVQGDAGAAADPVAELPAMGYTTRAATTRR